MELLPENLFYKELEAKNLIRNYLNNSAVSISGGKDSLVTLDLSIRVGVKRFIFGNTSMTFPETEDYIEKLEDFYDIKIEQVKPPRKFLDLVDDLGYPSQRLRWCCEVYKFGPLADYVLKNRIKFLITGIRSEESRKRQDYAKISKNPLIPSTQINPILKWNTDDIWKYIKYYNLPYHPLYDKGYDRLGCWMCPFQKKEGFERLNKFFPELYNSLIESLHKNVKKFGQVGVRDEDDYINEFAWTKNALPIRNVVVGVIEYERKNESVKYIIKCNNELNFMRLIKNLTLIKRCCTELNINKKNLLIEFFSKKLDINKVLIYCEKQINCVNCGACRSLCPNNAIEIKNGELYIDFSKCNCCLNCLSTSKLRGGCISRNYAPIRKKFDIINLNRDNLVISEYFSSIHKKIGLIKTKKKIHEVNYKLNNFIQNIIHESSISLKIDGNRIISSHDFVLNITKSKGFTLVYIECIKSDNVEEKINLLLNVLNK